MCKLEQKHVKLNLTEDPESKGISCPYGSLAQACLGSGYYIGSVIIL